MIDWLKNLFIDKTFGASRSPNWSNFRKTYIKEKCEVCGARYFLELHHVIPFWVSPELELFPSNVVTLCGGLRNCHLYCGHLGYWKSYNSDINAWILKVKLRP